MQQEHMRSTAGDAEHAKRQRLSPATANNDIILIPSKARNRLELVDMVAAEIDAPDCRTLVPLLSQLVPLPKTMRHVKRIRKTNGGTRAMILMEEVIQNGGDQSITCAADVVNTHVQHLLQDYANHTLHLARVPKYAPHSREYQEKWTKEYWPVIVIPPDKMTMRERYTISDSEGGIMRHHMNTVKALAEKNSTNACIIVNPVTNTIVGSGVDCSQQHPLKHPVFNAIQEVADWQQSTWYDTSVHGKQSTLQRVLNQPCALDTGDTAGHTDLPPYLCTGYDCYVLHEPCTMCAMALVHSRLRRIIYSKEDPHHGILSGVPSSPSSVRLHAIKSLNHHFVVYQIR